jgi:FkbM family methyltransferase
MYSQNHEDDIVLKYFGDQKKCVLEIGANDGVTLSNSLLLIENGWEAHLLEPNSNVFQRLLEKHNSNNQVYCYKIGIADNSGMRKFYESGELLGKGDHSLVSSIDKSETNRWGTSVKFIETEASFSTWQDFLKTFNLEKKEFNYISIDAEGYDWTILQQIDLTLHNCEVLCVEWNGNIMLSDLFTNYANCHGLFEIQRNAENIIFARKK